MTIEASTALITGGTSGIATNKLGQLGIHVLVIGRNVEQTFETRRAHARWREEQLNPETTVSIF